VTLAEKEVVGDDSLGEAWKASIRGIANDAVAQRLVIHDTQEDAFYEELQQSVRFVPLSSMHSCPCLYSPPPLAFRFF
jgi:hypothetical protein